MDKYQVLLFLIVYFLALFCVTILFEDGIAETPTMDRDTGMFADENGVMDWLRLFVATFIMPVPGIPVLLRVFFLLPFYGLSIYFIYLNLPLPLLNRSA